MNTHQLKDNEYYEVAETQVVKKKRKVRINWKNVRKLAYTLLVSALIIMAVSAIIFKTFTNSKQRDEFNNAEIQEVVVHKGDTLWGIAEELDFDGIDTREVVHRISKMNGIEKADIKPGDVIYVPVSPNADN